MTINLYIEKEEIQNFMMLKYSILSNNEEENSSCVWYKIIKNELIQGTDKIKLYYYRKYQQPWLHYK